VGYSVSVFRRGAQRFNCAKPIVSEKQKFTNLDNNPWSQKDDLKYSKLRIHQANQSQRFRLGTQFNGNAYARASTLEALAIAAEQLFRASLLCDFILRSVLNGADASR
jgi:hypothetical protein